MANTTIHNAKIVDQHTQQAEGYAKLTHGVAGGLIDPRAALRELVGIRSDDTLLDIACGPGSLTLDLAPHVSSATGLDLTAAMLDQARKAQSDRGLSNVTWVEGDAIDLPFPNASFSIVTSSAAFHHFEEPARVLAEMVRVCRPGGRVVVIDVTPEADKTADYDRMEHMRDPSHGHAHSVEELGLLGAKLGLGRPDVQTSLTGPLPFASVLATSHPESHSREELLDLMKADALCGENRFGFRAQISDGAVLVTYPMSTLCWPR